MFLAVVAATRYVSAGSMAAAVLFPFLVWITGEAGRRSWCWAWLVLAAVLIWRHRDNLRRLLTGTENRFGQPAGSQAKEREHD